MNKIRKLNMDNKVLHLFENTSRIINHQKEIEILKGEKFNIFSILGLEHYENTTHSTFLGELLNPNGSHLKGNIFLEHFFKIINVKHVDINTSKLFLEYSIGKRNDIDKSGGRIDIYIMDENGSAIAIENKIYAIDQFAQVERYVSYKSKNYSVYYLTLNGTEPTKESSGQFKSNEDYFLISYQSHIISWLELCLKETHDTPIIRETIRQYILLIKKLTNTMDNQSERELTDLMFKYYEEANYIASNFNRTINQITEKVRQDVIQKLKIELDNRFEVKPGSNTNSQFSQIWIVSEKFTHNHISFGMESFSGKGWLEGQMFVGLFNNDKNRNTISTHYNYTNQSHYWIDQRKIENFENFPINLSDQKLLNKIRIDEEFKSRFINYLSDFYKLYLEEKYIELEEFFG